MPLTPQTRLGPYEVLAAIGAGGMGEVYRARDTRLDRAVAIKVLPSHIADDAAARQRFEREILCEALVGRGGTWNRDGDIVFAPIPSGPLLRRPFLVIPEVSSERRDYVPIGWLKPPVIPSNLVRVLLDADLWHFGVLTSTMHMAWLRQIGGRLESRYRYSIGIVYNPFPWPEVTDQQRAKVRGLAQSVLDARSEFPNATLADLYDADAMPPKLRKAHRALDEAVDKLYRPAAFAGDRDRVEHLFGLYERLVAPLVAAAAQPRGRRSKRGGR